MEIDGKGHIVVAGYASNGSNTDFALARYIGTDEDSGDTNSSGIGSSGGCSVATLPGMVVLLLLPLTFFYRKN